MASVSVVQFRGHVLVALIAVVLIAAVGVSRVRGGVRWKRTSTGLDARERAARIRQARRDRYTR